MSKTKRTSIEVQGATITLALNPRASARSRLREAHVILAESDRALWDGTD